MFLSLSYRPIHEPLIFKRTFIHHAERNKLVFVHSQSTSRPVKLLANFQMQIPHSTFILYSLLKFCKMDKSHFVKILLIYIYIVICRVIESVYKILYWVNPSFFLHLSSIDFCLLFLILIYSYIVNVSTKVVITVS